jgi:outer membrane protein, heavy metal efflux system
LAEQLLDMRTKYAPFGSLPLLLLAASYAAVAQLGAQQPRHEAIPRALTLDRAREIARAVAPELIAAREAVAVATARERQAGAIPNPVAAYSREQTSGGGVTNSQNIGTLEQRIEIGGQRSARRTVAEAQRAAAEARVEVAGARLDYDVAHAYALAMAAERRASAIESAAGVFAKATQVSRARLTGGDISGYDHRRLTLEATRYAALRAEATAARRSTRSALGVLLSDGTTAALPEDLVLVDTVPLVAPHVTLDSAVALALARRAELRALGPEARAALAEADLARRERTPTPALTAGFKSERVGVDEQTSSGFVAGVSIPLPIWDRRAGAIEAAAAESRRRTAEADVARRQTVREVTEAYVAQQALAQQLDTLRAALGVQAAPAVRAAQVSYTEGEMSLLAWLDAVRTYQDAELTYTRLLADYMTSRAALERAVGVSLRESALRIR